VEENRLSKRADRYDDGIGVVEETSRLGTLDSPVGSPHEKQLQQPDGEYRDYARESQLETVHPIPDDFLNKRDQCPCSHNDVRQ